MKALLLEVNYWLNGLPTGILYSGWPVYKAALVWLSKYKFSKDWVWLEFSSFSRFYDFLDIIEIFGYLNKAVEIESIILVFLLVEEQQCWFRCIQFITEELL